MSIQRPHTAANVIRDTPGQERSVRTLTNVTAELTTVVLLPSVTIYQANIAIPKISEISPAGFGPNRTQKDVRELERIIEKYPYLVITPAEEFNK